MGKLILTGLTKKGSHNLRLEYKHVDGIEICTAVCTCGFNERVLHHQSYAGVKEIESIWNRHISI